MVFDLASDPGELYNIMETKLDMGWMVGVALKFVADFQKSVAQYPNIKTGEEFTGYA
jgi:arylsulfatase